MRTAPVRFIGRAVLGAALLVSCFPMIAAPASAAGYSRRIAIAPFASLTKEDIGATVSVLPRLLASRLMALAGADVVLLPAGGKAPEAAAKEAEVPLLLQGTVSKLGKGYSVDTTVTDLETGKTAGAFFAAAATEDDIIAQLGVLSGEISRKLFGVQGAIRAVSPPAPAPPAIPAVPAPSPAASALPVSPSLPSSPVSTPVGGGVPEEKWIPSSMKRVSRSDKIPDELHGIVAGDVDAEGNGEVLAFGRRIIYIYRVKGKDLLPYTRITRGLPGHILNVEAVDLDGDGKKEILVSGLEGEYLESTVLKRKGDVYEPVAGRIPWFLVVLPDWQGKPTVVGQRLGSDSPFDGRLFTMSWTGKTLAEGAPLPADTRTAPLSSGIPGLSSARLGGEGRLIYTDQDSHLRILDASGKTEYRSGGSYGTATDDFAYGLYLPKTGKSRNPVRKAARVSAGADGSPLFVIPKVRTGLLNVSSLQESRSIALLQWSDGEFTERADTGEGDYAYSGADFFSPSPLRKGGKVIASAIEKSGVVTGTASRLVLFSVE
ncbi:MAG: VCBS repeat-containing protein [Deltaproteobacteria bacterium]|nr:VCBS repeat-containing protein [Deltaproteobacteria bacterium]